MHTQFGGDSSWETATRKAWNEMRGNIKIYLREVSYNRSWIELAQNCVKLRTSILAVFKPRVLFHSRV
jgi:hypothetical protein